MNYHDVYLFSFVLGLLLLVFVSFQAKQSYIPPKKFPKINNFEIKILTSSLKIIFFSEILNIQNAR